MTPIDAARLDNAWNAFQKGSYGPWPSLRDALEADDQWRREHPEITPSEKHNQDFIDLNQSTPPSGGFGPIKPGPDKEDYRCAVCGWPLAEDAKSGCMRGNCSMRPRPETLYDEERANREHEEMKMRTTTPGEREKHFRDPCGGGEFEPTLPPNLYFTDNEYWYYISGKPNRGHYDRAVKYRGETIESLSKVIKHMEWVASQRAKSEAEVESHVYDAFIKAYTEANKTLTWDKVVKAGLAAALACQGKGKA